VGFKPTYGRCSRYGLVAFASSLDQIGPLAHTVEDAALMAQAITGHDPRDSTSLPNDPIDLRELKQGSLKGLRVGLAREFFGPSTDPHVQAVISDAIEALRREGAVLEELDLPSIQYGVTTYYIIAPAEASSNLARFDGIRYGPRLEGDGHIDVIERTRAALFGHEVKARIMIGTYALSAGYYDAFYLKAMRVRRLMQQEFADAFQRFDVLIGPTSPIPAFKLGELSMDPMALKLLDFCTIPANLLGCPAISLNAGFASGLPVGLQVMAPPMDDERLLQTAYTIEQALGASARPPEP
jgi:aspartyl-tRNA(Asn)/glutamyl-tRNA(Gln) amidotransferase subunit A